MDATDSIRLLRRLTLPKTWQGDEDAEPLDVADVRRAQVPRAPCRRPWTGRLLVTQAPC